MQFPLMYILNFAVGWKSYNTCTCEKCKGMFCDYIYTVDDIVCRCGFPMSNLIILNDQNHLSPI